MRAIPVEDGSLHVAMPDAQTRYDMGNRRLFVTFNGKGDVTRLLLPAGVHLGGWEITLRVGGGEVSFTQARAIGRLWELEGETGPVQVSLLSFAAEDAAVYQQCRIANKGARSLSAHIIVRFIPARPLPWSQRLRPELLALIPRLPGLSFLWSRGWAKGLPPERARLHLGDKTTVAFVAAERWLWSADQPPQDVRREGDVVVVTYTLAVPAEAITTLVWGVWPAAAGPEGLSQWPQALASAEAYARWLQDQAACREPLLRSLIVAGMNGAISTFKTFDGDFAGFLAGPDYAYPPRLYFRDGYWTAQVLLSLRPDLVRQHLLSLAQGVHADGECPSGVFVPGTLGRMPQGTRPDKARDWLPAHIDSPAFFVLLLWDYVRSTGDASLLQERVPPRHRRLWDLAVAAIGYLRRCDRNGDGLLEKPYRPNDWADNVRRSVWVTYDQALYGAALRAGAALALRMGETTRVEAYEQEALKARAALNRHLWLPDRGHYANYVRPGYTEAHVSIDTLLCLLYTS
ncbi:MAG: GH116 family glycosyl hydrolase, partial [Caldilineales bacterium]|nr:GH116 family glycosyl hydrolase [Caldilineales bacterium]